MPDADVESGRFVGRGAELATLVAALAAAAAGQGSTVLLAGEAGIGKTRLATELVDRARGGGATVLRGRCIDLAGPGVPYLALTEALDPVGGVPGGARRAGEPPGADAQQGLFTAVCGVLDGLATESPVLLVLDDLHWADSSTLDFVAYLARRIGRRRILLVATYRGDEVRVGDRLASLVVELQRSREATVVELPPLSGEELHALLESAAGRLLPVDLVEAVAARSGGNPFFAEELLAAADRGEQTLPRLLRDALLQRVARLDAAGQAVLRTAAAFGRDVPYRLLAAVTPTAEPDLGRILRAAVDHGLLVPDQPTATYRFRHPLLTEAVYATILPGEVEELHERLARALAGDPGLGGDRMVAGELARLWAAAGRPVESLAASLRAAEEAESVSGLAEARRHLERVLELWSEVPAADLPAGTDLAAVIAWTAELTDLTGDGPRAAALTRRAIDLVAGDDVRSGLLHERLGSYLLPIGECEAALVACRRAVDLVPSQPPSAERVRALTALGNALMLTWRHADSRAVCAEAVATAAAIGDDRLALRAGCILGIDQCYLGRPAEGLATLREAARRAQDRGTPRDVAHGYTNLCEVLVATGQLAEAAQVALNGLQVARRLGVERSFGSLLAAYAAEASVETGRWDRAADLLTAAVDTGATFWIHYPRLLRAQLATRRGDFAAARAELAAGAQGERQPTSAVRYAQVVAELALWEGRPAAAAAAVDAGLAGSVAGRSAIHRLRLATIGLLAQADRAELARMRRDPATVDDARERARRLVAEVCVSVDGAAAVTPDAAAWRATAAAEHARVGGTSEPDCWQAAAAEWDEVGRPYPAAYCRWRQAAALLASPRVAAGDAVRAARDAHRTAAALGAAPLRRQLELLARRGRLDLVGLVGLPPTRPDPTATLGLTAREGQVLRLLTRGYTNREIAAELTISVKTASVHVSHILHKLGVAGRVEAAAVAHRLAVG